MLLHYLVKCRSRSLAVDSHEFVRHRSQTKLPRTAYAVLRVAGIEFGRPE